MKKHFSTIILVLILLIGLSLLLYPSVSDYWNSMHQSRAIVEYAQQVAEMDDNIYEEYKQAAREYNAELREKTDRFFITEEEDDEYEKLLNVSGTGIIGYIEIEKIDCYLPIYHGTAESVLQIAIGHIEGTSLPVGGEGTHAVVSGHRGLPSAKLFTDLDKLEKGDTFLMRVLDETLTYEVDQILIVNPDELDALAIEADKDYCTLVTCTPYGINSHRLLVRGHRIENAVTADSIRVTADALQIEPVLVAPFLALPMLLVLFIWMLISTGRRKRRIEERVV